MKKFSIKLFSKTAKHYCCTEMESSLPHSLAIDRLTTIVFFQGKEQLLGVPEMSTSSGEEQVTVVYEALEKWAIAETLCFDTRASNTCCINGACTNIEKLFNRDLFYLHCRHHIFELGLKCCFNSLMGTTSGPEMGLLKRFIETWTSL